MNREIKFRAWDDINEEMVFPNDKHEPYKTALGIMIKHYDNLMQFTGLEDKIGNEIYEGDILSWRGNDNKDNKKLSKVIFKNGSFEVIGVTWMASWYLGEYNESYEVIGNIFENPELLER